MATHTTKPLRSFDTTLTAYRKHYLSEQLTLAALTLPDQNFADLRNDLRLRSFKLFAAPQDLAR
jgi:hypothetical protein